MNIWNRHKDQIMLRSVSSAYSRSAFSDILNFDDYSQINSLCSRYASQKCLDLTYLQVLKSIYSIMKKQYRCEYVFKNEIINQLLLKKYGTRNTAYISEFHVGNSVADLVLLNGESKVFEIKTEYDNPFRLQKQLKDYKTVFDKCYIVVPAEKLEDYLGKIDKIVGIVLLFAESGRVRLEEYRKASPNYTLNKELLMSTLRTKEYECIVESLLGHLPAVANSQMYKECKRIILDTEASVLRQFFLTLVKQRSDVTKRLRSYPSFLRQMLLSLNLTDEKSAILLEKLGKTLRQESCIIHI